jgi:hypothetical protein
MAIYGDFGETQGHVGEHSSPMGERLTARCELHVDFILRFTCDVERFCDFGETFTDAGQKLIERGSPFA